MNRILKVALNKATRFDGRVYAACLTYAEIKELIKDGASLSDVLDELKVETMRKEAEQGINSQTWFYFTLGRTPKLE